MILNVRDVQPCDLRLLFCSDPRVEKAVRRRRRRVPQSFKAVSDAKSPPTLGRPATASA